MSDGGEAAAVAATVGPALFDGVYAGRRVLVTGDTGFKGSWLCAWLSSLGAVVGGYALAPPTDPSLFELAGLSGEVAHVAGDVRDLAALRGAVAAFEPEFIFHLAAQPLVRASYSDPVGTLATNVMGTVDLFEAVRVCPSVRVVVVVTSDKCYENPGAGTAFREGDPLGGHDPYSASKACAEVVTAAYRRSFFGAASAVRVASARAGNVIGGGDWADDRLLPDCMRAIAAGREVVLRRPAAVRPWQHVLEPLSGYLWLGARLLLDGQRRDGAWNFGPGAEAAVPVAAVVEAFFEAYGAGSWRRDPAGGEQPHEAAELLLDDEKARTELGLRPVWDVRSAIAHTAAWYRLWSAGGADLRAALQSDVDAYVLGACELDLPWVRGRSAGARVSGTVDGWS
ncbi:MAG TPA: CDP-glucose 4,6-dehydratase [Thermoleophilia bacterium]|nr:CDP-glucose 4,6-dehydratase [Thermoleophilia bacterium]